MNHSATGLLGTALIVAGVVEALFGYAIYRFLIAFIGAIVGLGLGVICAAISKDVVVGTICVIGCPLLFAWLANTFVNLLIFLHGATLGMICAFIISASSWNDFFYGADRYLPAALVAGVICGIIAVIANRVWIIVSSAALGSLVAGAGLELTGTASAGGYLVIVLAGTVVGSALQFLMYSPPAVPVPKPASGVERARGNTVPVDKESEILRKMFKID